MPTLSLFSLAYLLSLLLFHSQTDLPAIWHTLNQVGGGPTVPLIACWALALTLLAKQGGMCHSRTQLAFFLLTAFACAQTTAGIQAAAHQQQQVPLSCNKQIIESKFRLVEKTFRDKGAQTWLIEHTPFDVQKTSKCLKPDARLQLFVESADLYRNITPSQQFRAALRIKPPKGTLQLEGFDVHRHWFANRIAGTAQLKSGIQFIPTPASWNPVVWMEQLRLHIANWIIDTLQGHPEQALVLAIVVGDQGLISPEDRDMFNTTGIAHLVAISGLHITLFAMLAGKLASNLWRRSNRLCLRVPAPLAGSLFGLLFAILYGLVAGWGVPAQRTVFMLFALCVGQLRGGLQSSWDTFFLALFLTLAFDSWALLDAGFMLSFGAVATLIFVTQGHVCFIKPQHEFVANAIKAQYAVTVGLILPCAMLFNQQSLISPVANALSIPWMSFVSTPLALLGGLLQHKWAIQLAADSLQVQREWLGVLNELSWAALPVHNQPLWINALVALGCLVLLLPPGLVSRWTSGGPKMLCMKAPIMETSDTTIEQHEHRSRLLEGMANVSASKGFAAATIADIVRANEAAWRDDAETVGGAALNDEDEAPVGFGGGKGDAHTRGNGLGMSHGDICRRRGERAARLFLFCGGRGGAGPAARPPRCAAAA